MSKRVTIIHGWESEPNAGWQPWLNNELSLRGFAVRTPAMPNPAHPKAYRWVEELQKIAGTPDENCHFVGHSLGCPAILRFIESLPAGSCVGTVVLVAGFMEDLGISEIANFVADPFDAEVIRSRCARIISIRSDADPYIAEEKFRRMEALFHAKSIVVQNGKHVSGNNGCYQLPEALNALLEH